MARSSAGWHSLQMTSSVHGYRGRAAASAFQHGALLLKAAGARPKSLRYSSSTMPPGRDVETWSYRALEEAILRTAYAFRSTYSLSPGSRIAIRLRNRTPYALAFFGAIAGGLVPIPLSPELTARELSFVLADSEAAAIVLDESLPHGAFDPGLAVIVGKCACSAAESGPASDYADTAAEDPPF